MKSILAAVALLFAGAMPLSAAEFPWEPAKPVSPPPLNAPEIAPPKFPTPEVKPPTRVVPGHISRYGYVKGYESGRAVAPAEPGQKTQGWVPGHHDNNGAWVPGHPE